MSAIHEAKSGKASRQKGRRGTAAPADEVPALAAASDSDDSDAEPELETAKTAAHGAHGNEAGVAHTGAKHFEGGSAASPPAGVDASGPPMSSGDAVQGTSTDTDAAIRPPQRLRPQQIAAAAALGMTSAGLAWQQQAERADAAHAQRVSRLSLEEDIAASAAEHERLKDLQAQQARVALRLAAEEEQLGEAALANETLSLGPCIRRCLL